MQAPRVSIIIPAFNAERYLRAAVDSALAQTCRDIEIIIVDDGSADGTLRIAQEAASADARIKVVALPANSGSGRARNAGMEAASGDFFMFLDADDLLLPEAAETALKEADTAEADIVRFELSRFSNAIPQIPTQVGKKRRIVESAAQRKASACALFGDPEEETEANIGGSACTALYSRRFFDEGVRFTRTYLSEDYLWNFECLMRCGRALYIPRVMYMYRTHDESKTHSPNPNLMSHIAECAEAASALMRRYGIEAYEADLFAMDYAVAAIRGLGKNAVLAPISFAQRKLWLRKQLDHPYALKIRERFPARRLGLLRRAAYYAFINGRFVQLWLLTTARNIIPKG